MNIEEQFNLIADDMLNVARQRFAGIDNVSYLVADCSRLI